MNLGITASTPIGALSAMPKVSELSQELTSLSNEIDYLSTTVVSLKDKLMPIMKHETPLDQKCEEVSPITEIGMAIRQKRDSVVMINETIKDILARLEI